MAAKNKRDTKQNERAKPGQKTKEGSADGFFKVMINLGGAVVAGILVMMLFGSVSGYDWLLNTMLKGNLETIEKYPNLTTQQLYEAKWGGEINYLFQIKNSTPDSAIIILPPRKALLDAGFKGIHELPHTTYFLYPRTVIYEDDKDKYPQYAKANYLVSVNGWGLDKFSSPVANPQPFMVLPLQKNN